MEEFGYTTVQQVEDGDIVFIGEEHGNPKSGRLADKILDKVQPNTVAIERGPRVRVGRGGRAAMGSCVEYARETDAPLLLIDESRSKYLSRCGNTRGINRIGNKFSHPIGENGNLNRRAITDARMRIRDKLGQDTYEAFYEFRERGMLSRLNTALDEGFETPMVVAVGTFHVLAMRDLYPVVDVRKPLRKKRKFFEDGPVGANQVKSKAKAKF